VQAPRSHRALVEEGKGCLNANPFLENRSLVLKPRRRSPFRSPRSMRPASSFVRCRRGDPRAPSWDQRTTEACAVLRTAYRSQRRELEGDRSHGACQLRPAYALDWAHTSRSGASPPPKCSGCSTAIGHTPTPGAGAREKPNFCAGLLVAPQLQRCAVITHSVPIMPPALQLLRRLLTR